MTDRDNMYSLIRVRDTWVTLNDLKRKREFYSKMIAISFVVFMGAILVLALRVL